MLSYLPLLISTNSYGVIAFLVFIGSSLVFMIPVLATRGTTQFLWFAIFSLIMTAEAAGLITLGILVNNGTIWRS